MATQKKTRAKKLHPSKIKAGMTILGAAGRELHVKDVWEHSGGRGFAIITREVGGMHFSGNDKIRLAA